MKIVSVDQMQTIERLADAAGVSYDRMMENAGWGIADWIAQHTCLERGVVGLVGSGNNGGDTVIALTWLAKWGARTTAFLLKKREGDPLVADYIDHGGAVVDLSENKHLDALQAALIPGTAVLDGILGTGLRLPLRGSLRGVMANIRKQLENRPDVLVIAVDCPSGVDCDTGDVSEVTITADHTLTMAAMKKGLLAHPARAYAGELHYIDIGIEDPSVYIAEEMPVLVDQTLAGSLVPKRPDSGHKGTFGTCLVIAGSSPYTGAAYLAGKAAYRAGCGLVHMGALKDVHRSLSGRLIEAVWTILPDIGGAYDPQGLNAVRDGIQNASSVVIGPGWGLSDQNCDFLNKLLGTIPKKTPLVIDADGLKLLAKLEKWWTLLPEQTILTPHPGEMGKLTGLEVVEVQGNRWQMAQDYAKWWNVALVLKGAMTVIASPQASLFVNPVSDAALATAGSGDVLTGLIGGLLAQGASPTQASVLGVWVHARAGILARKTLGIGQSVTALDILNHLPGALLKTKKAGF